MLYINNQRPEIQLLVQEIAGHERQQRVVDSSLCSYYTLKESFFIQNEAEDHVALARG